MKNTFTIKVRTMGQDDSKVIEGATSIMSNLGGFLVYHDVKKADGTYTTWSTQLDADSQIIIDGSDDSRFNRD